MKYVSYFRLWEIYFMEKPYIEEIILLYKALNGVKLIKEEMGYLKKDLLIISNIPNVIENKLVRIDIS
jgi:hypothetical protein